MAGETRGELAEAIAVVGLTRAVASRRNVNVFWEKRPTDALVLPDITIGEDQASPTHVVLVTACDTPRSSAMKYWRDLGELFDSKSGAAPSPKVISLVFRSSIKEELIRLESALCDAVLLVDRNPVFGADISLWLETHHATAPSKKEGKLALVEGALESRSRAFDQRFAAAMKHFTTELKTRLDEEKTALLPLWELCRKDTQRFRLLPVRSPKVTLFRRGVARWLVLDDLTRDSVFESVIRRRPIPSSRVPSYAVDLGMLTKCIGGYIIRAAADGQDMLSTVGSDMTTSAEFFLTAAVGDVAGAAKGFALSMADVPEFMSNVARQLRSLPAAVKTWQQFAETRWSEFVNPLSLFNLMWECYDDETMQGQVTAGGTGRVWLYDHCVALLRAATGRSNDYGYGPLGSLFQRERSSRDFLSLQKAILSKLPKREEAAARRWMTTTLRSSAEPGRRGFQDWLAKTKRVSPVVVASYAFALANLLGSVIGNKNQVPVDKLVGAHSYSLWNKLLTYPDFEGLPGLVFAACGDKVRWVSMPTLMSEIAGETVQDAGVLRMLGFKGGLVFWVSATDAGRGHKVKELSAKARCLRYQYRNGRFVRRTAAERLLLVVDGTFSRDDLEALTFAGWSALFYPDELGQVSDLIQSA